MTVSVCMCTYQGERYIERQLGSIYEQVQRPDEVIICDDGSTDQTVSLIRAFIREHNLEDVWHLIQNPVNLGYLANFYHALTLCHGDIIFFADQDDLWYNNKIVKMMEAFERLPEAKVVCCKFGLIDAKDQKIHSVMAPVHAGGTADMKQLGIQNVFRKCEWPAMVLAFRRDWYLGWKEVTEDCKIPHDYLFCAKAAEEKGFYQLDLELACHRRHGENVAKEEHRLGILLKKRRKLEEIEDYLTMLEQFEREGVLKTQEGLHTLHRKRQIMLDRRSALLSGKMLRVIQNKMQYGGEIRFVTFLCDLGIVKQKG